MKIEELSSGLSPNVRKSVLQKFQAAKVNGLICSDALARGIDIEGVDIVISYDAPRHIKTYIHRIGRTARAGKPGLAVTLLAQNEVNAFNVSQRFNHMFVRFIFSVYCLLQDIIKEGGKPSLEELMVSTSTEERKAKEYAKAVENMSLALKKEQQQRIMRSVNEKFKPNVRQLFKLQSKINTFHFSVVVETIIRRIY